MGQQTHTHNKWTCDVCRIAVFDTYDEAIQHEVSCTGAPPSAPPPSQQPRPQQQIGRTKQDNLSSKSSKEEVNVLLPNHRASSSISPSIGIKNGKCKVLSSSKNINNNVRKNRSSRNQDQGSTTSNNHHGEMLINGGGTFTNNSNSLFNYNLSSVNTTQQEQQGTNNITVMNNSVGAPFSSSYHHPKHHHYQHAGGFVQEQQLHHHPNHHHPPSTHDSKNGAYYFSNHYPHQQPYCYDGAYPHHQHDHYPQQNNFSHVKQGGAGMQRNSYIPHHPANQHHMNGAPNDHHIYDCSNFFEGNKNITSTVSHEYHSQKNTTTAEKKRMEYPTNSNYHDQQDDKNYMYNNTSNMNGTTKKSQSRNVIQQKHHFSRPSTSCSSGEPEHEKDTMRRRKRRKRPSSFGEIQNQVYYNQLKNQHQYHDPRADPHADPRLGGKDQSGKRLYDYDNRSHDHSQISRPNPCRKTHDTNISSTGKHADHPQSNFPRSPSENGDPPHDYHDHQTTSSLSLSKSKHELSSSTSGGTHDKNTNNDVILMQTIPKELRHRRGTSEGGDKKDEVHQTKGSREDQEQKHCHRMSSSSSKSSVEIPSECLDVQEENIQKKSKRTQQVFVCDICKSAYFDTFDEAAEHEKTCRGIPPPVGGKYGNIKDVIVLSSNNEPVNSLLTNSHHIGEVEVMMPKEQESTNFSNDKQTNQSNDKTNPSSNDYRCLQENDDVSSGSRENKKGERGESNNKESGCTQPRLPPLPSPSCFDHDVNKKGGEVCNIIRRQEFAHKIKGKDIRTIITVDDDEVSYQESENMKENKDQILNQYDEKKSSTNPEVLLTIDHLIKAELSPLLRNDRDSRDFFKLSSFNARLLSSIDLFEIHIPSSEHMTSEGRRSNEANEEKENRRKGPIVSFRCTHCRQMLSPDKKNIFSFWTRKKVKNKLCMEIYDHLHSKCEDITLRETQRLKVSMPCKDQGKISVPDFIEKYFDENGIVDNTTTIESSDSENNTKKTSHMIFLKPPQWVAPIYSCRRRTEALGLSEQNNDQSRSYKIFPLSGMKGLAKVESTLSTMNKLTINQLTFLIEESRKTIIEGKSFYHVAIRCKHCGTSTYINSLSNWFKFVYTMAYSHLNKTCQSIPGDLREKLNAHQGKGKKSTRNSKTTGLKQFCDLMSEKYNFMEKGTSFGIRVCVPEIPDISESITKAIIKKRKTRDSSESPQHKTPKTPVNKKLKLKDKENSQNGAIKVVYQYEEKQKSQKAVNVLAKDLTIEDENGTKTFLVPPSGVPLLCSFTSRMSSALNSHNRLLLDQFELVEDHSASTICSSPLLQLRCQNCNSNPTKTYTQNLTTLNNFPSLLMKCRGHLERCSCTPKAVKDELTKSKNMNSEGCITLKEYCNFLTKTYGMIDTRSNDKSVDAVTWCDSSQYTLIEGILGLGTLVEIAE